MNKVNYSNTCLCRLTIAAMAISIALLSSGCYSLNKLKHAPPKSEAVIPVHNEASQARLPVVYLPSGSDTRFVEKLKETRLFADAIILDGRRKRTEERHFELVSHDWDFHERDSHAGANVTKIMFICSTCFLLSPVLPMTYEYEDTLSLVVCAPNGMCKEYTATVSVKHFEAIFSSGSKCLYFDDRCINSVINQMSEDPWIREQNETANFGIGAQLYEDDGYCTIRSVAPGGPAARSKAVHEKDCVVAVAQGDQPPVDVVDMKLEQVMQLVCGAKGSEVRLTISPVRDRASRKIVKLIREEIKLEDFQAASPQTGSNDVAIQQQPYRDDDSSSPSNPDRALEVLQALQAGATAASDSLSASPGSAPPTVSTPAPARSGSVQWVKCTHCDGTGKDPNPKSPGPTFGNDLGEFYCDICKRTVQKPHVHSDCPVCKGKRGYNNVVH